MVIIKTLFIISIVLFSTNAFAKKCTSSFSKSFSISSDVGFGNQYKKSLFNKLKKHGVCIVEKSKGHPTRLGQESLRFEVKSGDCGYNKGWDDCKKDRERHELSGNRHSDGEYWYAWSIYLPKDFKNIYPTKLAMGQFHQSKGHVVWMFQNADGGYFVDNQVYGRTSRTDRILNQEEMVSRWNDILINANWTDKNIGFFRVWVNGKLSYKYNGPTKSKGKKVYQKFGVYRSFMSRYKMAKNVDLVPGQVVYFDEVRTGKSCSKLKLEQLDYDCKDLLSNLN
ncbi:polysaccharide lyase [Alphaproteobacteria bacterium]|nr:polysaccharide lyase [Alphaproteobacteria bacterium]